MLTKSQLEDLYLYFDYPYNQNNLNSVGTISFILLPKFDWEGQGYCPLKIEAYYFDEADNPITREKHLENRREELSSDLKQMAKFYFDVFSGDCQKIDDAFDFMKNRGLVDENEELIYE